MARHGEFVHLQHMGSWQPVIVGSMVFAAACGSAALYPRVASAPDARRGYGLRPNGIHGLRTRADHARRALAAAASSALLCATAFAIVVAFGHVDRGAYVEWQWVAQGWFFAAFLLSGIAASLAVFELLGALIWLPEVVEPTPEIVSDLVGYLEAAARGELAGGDWRDFGAARYSVAPVDEARWTAEHVLGPHPRALSACEARLLLAEAERLRAVLA